MRPKTPWVQTDANPIMIAKEIELVVNGNGVKEHQTVITKRNVI